MATSEKTLTLLVHQLGRVVHLGGCDGTVVCRHLVVLEGDNNIRNLAVAVFHLRGIAELLIFTKKNKDIKLEADIKLASRELGALMRLWVREQLQSSNTKNSFERSTSLKVSQNSPLHR